MKYPVSCPTTANRWRPNASISETRSAARVARSYPSGGLSVSPIPRWSTAMTVKSRAKVGITKRHAYQFSGQPCTSSSGGPSPPMTTCWRMPLASTKRLSKVLANPRGSFGALDTDPKLCGPLSEVPPRAGAAAAAVDGAQLPNADIPATAATPLVKARRERPVRDTCDGDVSLPSVGGSGGEVFMEVPFDDALARVDKIHRGHVAVCSHPCRPWSCP